MNPVLVRHVAAAVLLATGSSGVVMAQSRQVVSLDFTAGAATSGGGDRKYADDLQLDAELTLGVRPLRFSPGVFAVTAGVQGSASTTGTCDVVPGGTCAPEVPTVRHIGLIGGVERYRSHASLRILAGPAFYDGRVVPAKLGGLLQLDATTGWRHFAFVLSARGGIVPFFRDEAFYLGALGFGFRVQ